MKVFWGLGKILMLGFWLVVLGFSIYFIGLSIGGWLQGMAMLDGTKPFMDRQLQALASEGTAQL